MKKVVGLIGLVVLFLSLPTFALAEEVKIQWRVANGATGYKVAMSTNAGESWEERDAGTVLSNCDGLGVETDCANFTWVDAPSTGLVIFRVGAYNQTGEAWQMKNGAWFNGSWTLPSTPRGATSSGN